MLQGRKTSSELVPVAPIAPLGQSPGAQQQWPTNHAASLAVGTAAHLL